MVAKVSIFKDTNSAGRQQKSRPGSGAAFIN